MNEEKLEKSLDSPLENVMNIVRGLNEGVTYGYKGKKYKKLPAHVKTPSGWGNDDRSELGKAKDAITDKLGITNTKKHGVLAKEDAPVNNVGGGHIAGAVPGEMPPVFTNKKKRKPTPVGRYGSRRMWLQNGKS